MKRLGQLLLDFGWIDERQRLEALNTQTVLGGRIGSCLLEIGALDEQMLLRALAHQRSVPAARTSDLINIPEEVYSLLPKRVALRYQAVPFRMLGSELYVALLDVDNLDLHDEIAFATGKQVRVHIGNEVRIWSALHRYYNRELSERFRQLEARLDASVVAVSRRSGFGRSLGQLETEETQSSPTASFPAPSSLDPATTQPRSTDSAPISPSPDSRPPTTLSSATTTAPFLRRFATAQELGRALDEIDDRERMAQLFMEQVRHRFKRVLLFKILPEVAVGWMRTGEREQPRELRSLEVDLSQPSIFHDLMLGRPVHQGPLAALSSHRPLFAAFAGDPPAECLSFPIRIGRRLVSVLVGEPVGSSDGQGEARVEVSEAAVAFGDALGRFVLRQKGR